MNKHDVTSGMMAKKTGTPECDFCGMNRIHCN